MCSPSCIVPPSDPVVLPENVTADTVEHWMEPIRVQVSTGAFLCHRGAAMPTDSVSPGVLSEAFRTPFKQTTTGVVPTEKGYKSRRKKEEKLEKKDDPHAKSS